VIEEKARSLVWDFALRGYDCVGGAAHPLRKAQRMGHPRGLLDRTLWSDDWLRRCLRFGMEKGKAASGAAALQGALQFVTVVGDYLAGQIWSRWRIWMIWAMW
jgi:hypothetical protein